VPLTGFVHFLFSSGFATTIEQDEAILAGARRSSDAEGVAGGASTSGSGAASEPSDSPSLGSLSLEAAPEEGKDALVSDPCYLAAVKYRLERKRAIKACRLVLSVYGRAE